MKIWHVNIGNHSGRVDGVAAMSTRLAGYQASAGHDVHLWTVTAPEHRDEVIRSTPEDVTLRLHGSNMEAARSLKHALVESGGPDVVHLHSVFRPVHAYLALMARRRGVPVVQTTHAGLDPTLLGRDRHRKWVYRWLVERWALRSADAVIALQELEVADIRAFSGRKADIDVLANSVDDSALTAEPWSAPTPGTPPVAVMLSRYDVLQKGLDRMVAMARSLPHVEFRVHGSQDKNDHEQFAALRSTAPPNVRFLDPVYDDDKYAALGSATLFLQPSRAEGVSLALTEAMTLGVPCAVSTFVDRSLDLARRGAALVLDDEPSTAARQVADLLDDPDRLVDLGSGAARMAAERFDPVEVARAHVDIYERIVGS